METTHKFKVTSIDAWRTSEGWDINNWHNAGTIEITSGMDGKDLINLMIDEGYLARDSDGQVYIDRYHDDVTIRICATRDHEPLYDLMAVAQ